MIQFERREGITIEVEAEIAGKSVRMIRIWCEQHQIGRRVSGGPWVVGVVALRMLLNDGLLSLRSYLVGNRSSPAVVDYYAQADLKGLLNNWRSRALTG
ncbi:MAG: hypothetical protein K2Y56_24550 [Methylobacterium sp.]|nr:hypothetical protein [Methylobacterium sp.]